MRVNIRTAVLAAGIFSPAVLAVPTPQTSVSPSTVTSVSSAPELSTYPYTESSSASLISEIGSFSISFGSGSWSNFPTSSDDLGQSPVSSSGAVPYGSLGGHGSISSHTVLVESFTVAVPVPTVTSTPKSVSSGPSVSSPPQDTPTLSTVTATATVSLKSGSATVVHTFTVTESAVSESLVSPFPSASLSLDSSVLSDLSRSVKSASSLGSALRSIFSDINGSQSGVGPVVVAPNSATAVSTRPGKGQAAKGAESMITATFTLTVPTSTFFVPILPTHTGSMITAGFTITLPAPPKSTEGTQTSTIQSSSGEVTTVTESCSTSITSTSCEETPAPTGFPETLTYTLSTKVTLTIDEPSETSSLASPVPSGSDAITLTYTLPGGPGRANQTVTITTVRPTGQGQASSVGSSGSVPSASASLPSGASSSGIWSIGNSSSISAGPTVTGSIPFSFAPSASLIPSPAISGVIVITQTKTLTQVLTATAAAAHTSLVVGNPHNNVTTFAVPTGTGVVPVISTGTGTGGPNFSAHGPFANATGSIASSGVASPTNGVHFDRREAECNRSPKDARVVLNASFDDAVIQGDSMLAPNTQGFANPDQGMQFSGGFERIVYSSSSNDRFVPSSMPAMLKFSLPATTHHGVVNGMAKIGSANTCSRFNLESWNLGCDSVDTSCRFNITGFRLIDGHQEVVAGSKVFVVPAATKSSGNALHLVEFAATEDFSNLSSFIIQLLSNGNGSNNDNAWWSDDLSVARVCSGSPVCTTLDTLDTMAAGDHELRLKSKLVRGDSGGGEHELPYKSDEAECEEWPCNVARGDGGGEELPLKSEVATGDGGSGEHELPYWRRKTDPVV
ncbi:hypothetical protein Sste5346_008042 [Sporothrix stenoceras]|uniref:DUF7371 domain-containing protein n=1 Tax=Sporothrix stenoceras TaxID=5173 RepID=A0ABR3YQZ5_9PEZI